MPATIPNHTETTCQTSSLPARRLHSAHLEMSGPSRTSPSLTRRWALSSETLRSISRELQDTIAALRSTESSPPCAT